MKRQHLFVCQSCGHHRLARDLDACPTCSKVRTTRGRSQRLVGALLGVGLSVVACGGPQGPTADPPYGIPPDPYETTDRDRVEDPDGDKADGQLEPGPVPDGPMPAYGIAPVPVEHIVATVVSQHTDQTSGRELVMLDGFPDGFARIGSLGRGGADGGQIEITECDGTRCVGVLLHGTVEPGTAITFSIPIY